MALVNDFPIVVSTRTLVTRTLVTPALSCARLHMAMSSRLDEFAERAHGPRAQAGDRWTAVDRANLLILQQTDWAALARAQLR